MIIHVAASLGALRHDTRADAGNEKRGPQDLVDQPTLNPPPSGIEAASVHRQEVDAVEP